MKEEVMRKLSLITAILLLASAWMLAQSSTSPSQQYPSTAPSSAQDAQQTAQTAKEAATTVEGCVGGAAGAYTLTDSSGKTYQLAGDTSKLGDHVGHDVKITGTVASAAGAGAASAAGGNPTLTIKKVKMVSATCTSK
jgi:hypothetical protein